jgi:glycyl-tRNA synthetase
MKFKPSLAPIKAAVMPLMKKPDLEGPAMKILRELQKDFKCEYDTAGSIGKRYRRQDEVGTPYCVTVDFDTIGENGEELKDTVTLRERDSMKQERIAISELRGYLLDRIL